MTTLITGVAGFIGSQLAKNLLDSGVNVIGIDNLNDYYDVNLKKSRLQQLQNQPNFQFIQLNLADRDGMGELFNRYKFNQVVNLAAQAGVRYSLENPNSYVDSNIVGFVNLLEGCRYSEVEHLVFASSSSVYGLNTKIPFSVQHNVDHPVSLYAATKKTNELIAHTYSHLYGLPTTGLRFFTVYGPWGRPDMAYFKFTKAILADQPIEVYNHGRMQRDFTYIDDIVEGVTRILRQKPQVDHNWSGKIPNPSSSTAPYRIYNIGNSQPVDLMYFIGILETILSKKANIKMLSMQPGDVKITYANIDDLKTEFNWRPQTSIEDGLTNFINWYQNYYRN
ncbi:NAD-dependent epimerase [Thiotrichales bacterium HSG1]|nr:NAD-dependent epimerase [Thiotrichales bacterium HSG1]